MKLTIIGASGHGKVVADIAAHSGYDCIEFLDDDETISNCGNWHVVGKSNKAAETEGDLFIAIGNAKVRKRLMELYSNKNFVSLVHPNAVIANDVELGCGTVVMAGAVINPGAFIGNGCIINTCSSVDHDCTVGEFVHVAVGAHLCGTVTVGNETWVGAGATVSNNVSICSGCMIGAGAVVIRDINAPGTYVGVPARRIIQS